MQLNYNHLYYFHIAAIEGTVAAAAHRLGVTSATVSEQVRALERALGVDLFERTQSGLKLTDSGKLTFEHTATMFRLGERLVEILGNASDDPKRQLRVGVSLGVARSISTTILTPLFGIPDCVPAVRTGDTVDLLRDLRAGLLELALCEGEPPESTRRGLEIVPIDRSPMVAIAAPHVTPTANWSNVGVVLYRATTSYRKDIEAFLEARGLEPRIAGEADDSLLLLEAAIRQGLVAIVPRATAKPAIDAGAIRVLENIEPISAVHAVYPDNLPAALARRAVELMVQQAKAESGAE
jgi:LysR family transcriptional regulator, transcriptional activator of nhaA